jgi:tol-pal system protein YbgF
MEKVRGTGKVIESFNLFSQVTVLQRFLFPVLFAVTLLLAGCASDEEAQNRSTLINLEREMTQIKNQTSGISVVKENQSTLLSQISDFSKELQTLRGRFDENKYFQDKTLKDIMSELELLKSRIASLEGQPKDGGRIRSSEKRDNGRIRAAAARDGAGDSTASDEKQAAPKNSASVKGPDSAAKIYDEAHIALKEKRYGAARKMFERFIKEYPKEGLAPNAYFWIGEAYYSEKKYEEAILAYEEFIKKYRKHDKAKGAMLKQAYSFLNLSGKNNRLAGKDILEGLIEKYPKTKEADLAKKKLKEISKSAPASKKTKRKN